MNFFSSYTENNFRYIPLLIWLSDQVSYDMHRTLDRITKLTNGCIENFS